MVQLGLAVTPNINERYSVDEESILWLFSSLPYPMPTMH